MKKLVLSILGVIFMISSIFGQSFIGMTKKQIIADVKERCVKIEKPSQIEGGDYSITIKFQNSTAIYTFSKDGDMCYFYIVVEKYYPDNYYASTQYYDDRYLRAFGDCNTELKNKQDVWKEAKGGETFVYRWIVLNLNKGVQYTLYLTKENYDINKYTYMERLLK